MDSRHSTTPVELTADDIDLLRRLIGAAREKETYKSPAEVALTDLDIRLTAAYPRTP